MIAMQLCSGRKPRLLAAVAAGLLLAAAVAAGGEERPPVPPLDNVRIAAADGRLQLSWSVSRQFAGDFRGARLFRVRDGRQAGFGQPAEDLVEDVGLRTSWIVEGLENGEQYEFILTAYDSRKRELWRTSLYGYPGTDPRGAPRTPAGLYTAAGDGRLALFWERNREADLILYEVQRKGPRDREFRTVARLPKAGRLARERQEGGKGLEGPVILSQAAYQDRSVTNGESYQYRVRAVDAERKASSWTDPVTVQPRPHLPPSGQEIVLIVNSSTGDSDGNGVNDSEDVARHYAERRGVPAAQIVRLRLPPEASAIDYARDIQKPLRQFLLGGDLAGRVTTLVPCFGIPIRSGTLALDSRLADLFDRFIIGRKLGTPHPYFNANRHFDATYGVYLVTRLDGPTVGIARGLVDKALAAEGAVTARSGRGYLGGRGSAREGDVAIRKAAESGKRLGVDIVLKDPGEFGEHELGADAYWYFAWYHRYRDPIRGQWPVGAVGSHLISNSFATIREANPERKSWVQGLLEQGITATFGAVVEPYETGYTRPDIFFSHFWTGDYTFAESFLMATPTVQWAMSAVGDPLFRLRKLPGGNGPHPAPAGNAPPGGSP